MSNQTPLNPDALEAGAKALLAVQQPEVSADYAWNVQFEDGRDELRNEARAAVSAYLGVAQLVVNSVEELDALPQETVIRSVIFGVVRERMDSGWLATGADEFESTDEIAGRDHVVLHRPEVDE